MFGFGKGGLRKAATELWTFTREVAAGKVGDWAFEHVKRTIADDPRNEVMNTVRRVDEIDNVRGKKLWDWLELAEASNWPDLENNVLRSLGHLLPRDDTGKVNRDEAVEVFRWVADLTDDQYKVLIAAMKHDPIAQQIKYWISKGMPGLKFVSGTIVELVAGRVPEIALNSARGIDRWAANTAAPAVRRFGNSKWIRRSRRRRRRLETQQREHEEQLRQQRERQTRERVAELFDQLRHERSDRRGGRQ